MPNAIVTVRLSGSNQEYDLEVPTHVPSDELAELITSSLTPGVSTKQTFSVTCLRPERLTRRLKSEESLAQVGLWDGAFLLIEPVGAVKSDIWQRILFEWEPFDYQLPPTGETGSADWGASPAVALPVELVRTPESGQLNAQSQATTSSEYEAASIENATALEPESTSGFSVQWEPLDLANLPQSQHESLEDPDEDHHPIDREDKERPSPDDGYVWKKL